MSYYFAQTLSTRRNSIYEQFTFSAADQKQESYYKRLLLFDAIKKNNLVYIARKLHHSKHFLNDDVSGKTFLTEAVKQNRKKIVKVLLLYSADPNKPDKDGKRPLHYSAINGNYEITKALLKSNADPTLKDTTGHMPISYLSKGHPEFYLFLTIYLSSLEDHIIQTSEVTTLKQTIKDLALSTGSVLPLQMLVKSSDIDKPDKDGNPPVFVAIECTEQLNRSKMLDYLHIEGADFNNRNEQGDSLLHLACHKKDKVLANTLIILYGVNFNTMNKCKDTPLHICARKSCNDIMEGIFFQHISEKDFQQQNSQGNTILLESVINQNMFGIDIILNQLKSLTSNQEIEFLKKSNTNGDTVLQLACREKQDKTVNLILEIFIKEIRSFDNKQLRKELTEIHEIIYKSYLSKEMKYLKMFIEKIHEYNLDCYFLCEILNDCEVFEIYLDNGLSVNTVDDQGHSILHYVVEQENIEVLTSILKQTIDIGNKTDAIYSAVKKKNIQMIELMMNGDKIEWTVFQTHFKDAVLKAMEQKSYAIVSTIIEKDLNSLLHLEPDPLMAFDYLLSQKDSSVEELTTSLEIMLNHYEKNHPHFSKITASMCLKAYNRDMNKLTRFFVQYSNVHLISILHEAVTLNKLEYIEHLIANEINTDIKNKHGNTALHVAIRKKEIKKAYLLLEKGADVNAINKKGETCFHYAIEKGIALNLLPFLIQETYNQYEYNTLDGRKSQTDIAGVLKHSVNVNRQNIHGNTCLHTAILKQDNIISQLLVRSGADVFLLNANQETPLQVAFQQQEFEILYMMFQRLHSIVLKDMFIRLFLSIAITSNEHSETTLPYLVQMISIGQVDLNTPDKNGELALNTAVEYNRMDIVQLLLENNAKPNVGDRYNMSSFDYAVKKRNREMLITLWLAQTEDIINSQGETLLHLAVRFGDINLLQEILQKDSTINAIRQCDLNASNTQGKTPLTIAVELQNLQALWILLDNKADLRSRNVAGNPVTNLTTLSYTVIRKIFFKLYKDDTYRADHLKEFECPVCLDIPEKVLSCSRGHVICSKCRQKLECPNCPMCRVTLSIGCSRSLKHEQEIKQSMIKIIQKTF